MPAGSGKPQPKKQTPKSGSKKKKAPVKIEEPKKGEDPIETALPLSEQPDEDDEDIDEDIDENVEPVESDDPSFSPSGPPPLPPRPKKMSEVEKETKDAVVNIYKELKRQRIDTSDMVDYSGVDPKVKKVVQKSNLIDSSWKELIKAKAIVNPSEYIADRAEAIKEANRSIAKELNAYYNILNSEKKDKLPPNKIKALLERKLLTSASDHYAEINTKYPVNNLAASLQRAISSSRMKTAR